MVIVCLFLSKIFDCVKSRDREKRKKNTSDHNLINFRQTCKHDENKLITTVGSRNDINCNPRKNKILQHLRPTFVLVLFPTPRTMLKNASMCSASLQKCQRINWWRRGKGSLISSKYSLLPICPFQTQRGYGQLSLRQIGMFVATFILVTVIFGTLKFDRL